MSKPVKAWGVKSPADNSLILDSIRSDKIICTAYFAYGIKNQSWDQCEEMGFECVQVEIKEVGHE